MPKKISNNDLVTKSYFKAHLRQELTKFRSKILEAVDAVMKEVVATGEEQTVHFHQHERINEQDTPGVAAAAKGGWRVPRATWTLPV